jgi:FkbM family methyltransferase
VIQSLQRGIRRRVKHWSDWMSRSDYRYKHQEFGRLEAMPRYQAGSTELLGRPLGFVDAASFLFMYDEIFMRGIYRFESHSETPYIIDGGANIGLSVLYFKQLYPMCRIVAFEPDPQIFEVLQGNLKSFGCTDVALMCKALWSSETSLSFSAEGADGGRVRRMDDQSSITVPAITLRQFLKDPVALLKLDIEGAETRVLADCADLLGNVERIFVEYHSFAKERQDLHTLATILANAGFRLHVHPPLTSPQPFVSRRVSHGMDLQLNFFAFR